MLDYAFEEGKDKKNKECYQHLAFDFSDGEVKKVAKDVKELCRFDLRAFAYLSNYLLKFCYVMEERDKSVTVQMVNERISKTI